MLHLVAMAADEVRGSGITVNCVVPSIIDTPANRSAMPDADHASWPKVPDIAQAYLFLASPARTSSRGHRFRFRTGRESRWPGTAARPVPPRPLPGILQPCH